MNQQEAQQVERVLRQNWQQIRYQILDQFAEVNSSDLDAASSVDDLVQRIADRSHYSDRYVESRIRELVGVAAGAGTGPAAQPTAAAAATAEQAPAPAAAEQPGAGGQAEQSVAEQAGAEQAGAEQAGQRFGGQQPFTAGQAEQAGAEQAGQRFGGQQPFAGA
ncbi:hypothetical protein ThrDRAFT_03650 [Frankia casuarinae]|nr:hypothetical protein [Frankia casuarinae]EYT90714.1 hypothetical protein ThrDRAFT_03650 [Frankia casuarinae]